MIKNANGDLRNLKGIENYTKFWDKDSAKDTADDTEGRKAVYTDVVNSYYDGQSHLLSEGGAEER